MGVAERLLQTVTLFFYPANCSVGDRYLVSDSEEGTVGRSPELFPRD
jgi:hypothetical protein